MGTEPARPARSAQRLAIRDGAASRGARVVAEETPIAIVHDAATYAVMMATPADLEDFAIGFSLTEGVIERPEEVTGPEIAAGELGIELRMWLSPDRGQALSARRRTMAGPTGCGLCGIESLEALKRPRPRPLAEPGPLTADDIRAAMASIDAAQTLGRETRAVHAAGFWRKGDGLIALREDVGRHNALDKVAGALAVAGVDPATGFIVITSRLSIELVQKAAMIGCPMLVAVSAPTNFALRAAERAGMTLVAIARDNSFEVFTHRQRLFTAAIDEPR